MSHWPKACFHEYDCWNYYQRLVAHYVLERRTAYPPARPGPARPGAAWAAAGLCRGPAFGPSGLRVMYASRRRGLDNVE